MGFKEQKFKIKMYIFHKNSSSRYENKNRVNRYSHTSPISQSSFFEKVCCLILASSQMELRG